MPRAYAEDLRSRVIAAVEAGRSAREAARVFQVSPSAAIKWVQRWRRSGSVAAKPMGGERRSPLDRHADYLLALVAAEPDLTLAEIRGRLRARAVHAPLRRLHRKPAVRRGSDRSRARLEGTDVSSAQLPRGQGRDIGRLAGSEPFSDSAAGRRPI